ncbi:hypothetical protein [Actibacterium sp. 188UL27-1]|uniref:hypothetical protein n=1 Tax=Actibacterium sp. 188UL27-1 TaxID=2786961 RepID=UPI00195AB7B5|nr:hypothetical protein [Actibacterium sp. 188UL27-1]MBM7070041.1 hypothetical protein [Actibacterium sp. 188UL27-1]
MRRRQKIAVFLCSDMFYRNYVTTGVLTPLTDNFDVTFIVSPELFEMRRAELEQAVCSSGHNVRVLNFDPIRLQQHKDLLDILMFHHADLSTSFKYRVLRNLGVNLFLSQDGKAGQLVSDAIRSQRYKQPKRSRRKRWRTARLRFISRFKTWVSARKKTLRRDNPVGAHLAEEKPDLIICPSSAYDPEILDAINAANEMAIPSLLLVDNWDNASSKSIFWARPTHLGCWGSQSVEHVHRIQGIAKNVHALGTPRFEVYRDMPEIEQSYVLFLGTAIGSDEISVLECLDQLFAEGVFPANVEKIIYRPHPFRRMKAAPDVTKLAHVQFDDSLGEREWTGRTSTRQFPELDQYPKVLAGAALVVSGYTSMMIEALLCKKPVLALAHEEEGSQLSPHLVEALYEHFDGTERIEGVTVCRDLTALRQDITKALTTCPRLDDPALQHIVSFTDTPYAERLSALVHAIIQET